MPLTFCYVPAGIDLCGARRADYAEGSLTMITCVWYRSPNAQVTAASRVGLAYCSAPTADRHRLKRARRFFTYPLISDEITHIRLIKSPRREH